MLALKAVNRRLSKHFLNRRFSTTRYLGVSDGRSDDGGIQTQIIDIRHDMRRSVDDITQGFQGRDHEFSPYRTLQTMDRSDESSRSRVDASNIDSIHELPTQEDDYGVSEMNRGERDSAEAYGYGGPVSMDGAMQSQVPEPFNPQGRNPSHVNMPGGGQGRHQKYIYGNVHAAHPSKQYSTSSTGDYGDMKMKEEKLSEFLSNCEKYPGLNGEMLLLQVQNGEKTFKEAYDEHLEIIAKLKEEPAQYDATYVNLFRSFMEWVEGKKHPRRG